MPSKGLIRFFAEEVPFSLPEKRKHAEWIKQAIRNEGFIPGEINIIFCSDNYLLNINRQYLNHDTYTDIVTFDQREQKEEIAGDIFISIDRIKENAEKFQTELQQELRRVMIHGILHLAGYRDKSLKEKTQMREKEDYYISL